MRDLFSQYRLRKMAVQLRRFTVTDLASASKSSLSVVRSFVNRLEKNETNVLTKKNIASERPGRPVVLYGLTPQGIRLLAAEIAPIAQELNEVKVETASATAHALPGRTPSRPALGQYLGMTASGDPMPSHEELGSDSVSIVVADSTRIHTQLLAEVLRNDRGLQVVAAASNSEELLAAVTRVPIDVVVISHNFDNQPGHGTQVLREMRALRPQIKGVILLDSSKPQEVLECFRAGARGIFSNQERLESLCQCIRSVHEGQIWVRSVDLDQALEALASAPLVRATNQKGIELLSARERQVIQHVAGGMSNREIAHALDLSPHTVTNYLFRIFDKLGWRVVHGQVEQLDAAGDAQPQPIIASGESDAFSAMIEAAEAGDPSQPVVDLPKNRGR